MSASSAISSSIGDTIGPIILALSLFLTSPTNFAQPGNNPGNNGRNPNQDILERLDALEAKIDALAGPQINATFCISQGRNFALKADWIYQLDIETEFGLGWAEVVSAEATA